MNITLDREQLLTVFQTAATVVPTRSPKPILQNVKLDITPDKAVLMATDTEVGIRLEVPGIEITAPGSVILPVNRMGPILRESTDEKLNVTTDGNHIVIKGQRSEFKLPAHNPDEFPEVADFKEEKYHELPARLMKELIRRTLFATDSESSRYALGGILLELEAEKIIAVGTDGRRLAKMEGPTLAINDHQTDNSMTIVPARAMQLIERALSDADAEIQLAARGNDILVKSPRATIYARLVEGRFPRWRDVIPNDPAGVVLELTVGPLFAAVRQTAIVTTEESRGIKFVIQDGTIVLSSSAAEIGQSRIELPVSYDGEEILITLDHRFIGDFLRVLDPQKTVSLNVKDNDSAALFETNDGYTYVVMPLFREGS